MLLKQNVIPMAPYGQGLGGNKELLALLQKQAIKQQANDPELTAVDIENDRLNAIEFGDDYDYNWRNENTGLMSFADKFNDLVGDSQAYVKSFFEEPQQSAIPVQQMQNQYNPYGQQAYANLGFGNSMPQRQNMYRY